MEQEMRVEYIDDLKTIGLRTYCNNNKTSVYHDIEDVQDTKYMTHTTKMEFYERRKFLDNQLF